MGSHTGQRARPPGPRLFEGPTFFGRTRRDIAELIGLVWLSVEVVRLVRSRLEKATAVSPRRGDGDSRGRRHAP